jgi:hypothetical protein
VFFLEESRHVVFDFIFFGVFLFIYIFGGIEAPSLQFYFDFAYLQGAGEPEGSRHLVFMTYMNDVTDAGGTEFYHQVLSFGFWV